MPVAAFAGAASSGAVGTGTATVVKLRTEDQLLAPVVLIALTRQKYWVV